MANNSTDSFITEIKLDSRQLELDLDGLKVKFGATASHIASAWSIATAAVEKVREATAGFVEYMAGAVEAATEAEQAEVRLSAAIVGQGAAHDMVIDTLKSYNAALQQKLAVDGDNLTQVQATLSAMGVYPSDLQRATLAVIGLTERTGAGLEPATLAVGKAILGNTVALQRLGVTGTDATSIINELAAQSALAEARANTFGGQLTTLRANTGDLTETVGAYVTQNRAAQSQVSGFNAVVRQTTTVLEGLRPAWNYVTENSRGATSGVLATIPVVGQLAATWDGVTWSAEAAVRAQDAAAKAPAAATGQLATPESEAEQAKAKAAQERHLDQLVSGFEREMAEYDRFNEKLRTEAEKHRKIEEENEKKLDEAMARFRVKAESERNDRFHRAIEQENRNLAELRKLDIERIRTQTDAAEEENSVNIDVWMHRLRTRQEQMDAEKAWWQSIGEVAQSGAGQLIGGTLIAAEKSLLAGDNVLAATGKFLGGLLVQTGEGLVAIGSAAVAAQLLSAIPFLAPLVGVPGASAAAGAAAIGAGAALIAAGIGLGAVSGSGSGSGGGSSGGGAGSGRSSAFDAGAHGFSDRDSLESRQKTYEAAHRRKRERADAMRGPEMDGPSQTIVNVYNRGRPLVTKLETGREVEAALRRADRARGRPSWGGRGRYA